MEVYKKPPFFMTECHRLKKGVHGETFNKNRSLMKF